MKPKPFVLPLLIDGATISCKIPLSQEFVNDPQAYANAYGLDIREVKQGFKRKKDRNFPFITFFVGDYGGIRVYASPDEGGPWFIRNIRSNPTKVAFGHNGRSLTTTEFGIALSIIVELLKPFLKDPADATKLIPGTSSSEAFWQSLEFFLHISGEHLGLFNNARHPWIRTRAQRYEGESFKLGKPSSDVMINFYRKDEEMKAKMKPDEPMSYIGGASEEVGVLRVEVTLKGQKLIDMLGGAGNTRVIDGVRRLTCFTPEMLVRAHRAVVSKLQGCFLTVPGEGPERDKDGRFIAIAAVHTGASIDELLERYKERFNASRPKMVRLRSAAVNEASRLSPVSMDDLFSDEAYQAQLAVILPEKERIGKHRRDNTAIHPEIARAYGIPGTPPSPRRFVP